VANRAFKNFPWFPYFCIKIQDVSKSYIHVLFSIYLPPEIKTERLKANVNWAFSYEFGLAISKVGQIGRRSYLLVFLEAMENSLQLELIPFVFSAQHASADLSLLLSSFIPFNFEGKITVSVV
jgi:hypothetical protein